MGGADDATSAPDGGGSRAGGQDAAPGDDRDSDDELSAAQRAQLQRWQPPGPPVGFAERALAARAAGGDGAPRPASPRAGEATPSRRRALAWGGGALAALGAAAVALSLMSRAPRPPTSATSAASSGAPDRDALALPTSAPMRWLASREAIALGGRGIAVAEPGAALGWRRDGAATHVEQESGEVFYRVDPGGPGGPGGAGGPFTVVTAVGEIRVTGTCFRVEVIAMQPIKQGLIGAVAGAALATAAVVTVYEGKVVVASPSGSAQVRAGERATLTPDRPPVLTAGAPAQAVAIAELPPATPNASREELLARDETLRQQVAQLAQRVRQLQAVAVTKGPGKGEGGGKQDSWLDKTPEQLLEFARECRVQIDFPAVMRGTAPRLDPEAAAALELSTAQVSDVNQVFTSLQADWVKRVRGLYVEATGDTTGAESLSPQAMGEELGEKAAPGEPDALQRRIAEERAGLLPVPADAAVSKASPFERYFRALANLGDDAERAMAVVLGAEKAHALRARSGGWPARMGLAGCRDGATASEPE